MSENKTGRTLCSNRIFALIWRLIISLFACYGIAILIQSSSSLAITLSYFTTQSNILIAGLFIVLSIGTLFQILHSGTTGEVFHIPAWLQLGFIFTIQITFLVFAFMLSGSAFSMGGNMAVSNIMLHYVVPLMALADWILFLPHGLVLYRQIPLWLIYSVAYVVFAFIRARLGQPYQSGSRFPYFFMDADVLGLKLLWIFPLFLLSYLALGCLLVLVDKLIARGRN